MIYIKLYLIFLQVGILSFGGGYSALPLIQEFIVEKYGFITTKTMIDIVSISQMTPGPIAINAATFVGMNISGLLGSIFSTMGVITPQVFLLTIFLKFIGFKNKYVNMMLDGVSVAIVALISVATVNLINETVITNISILNVSIFLLGIYLYKKSYSIISLVIISAIIGVVFNA